MKKHLFFILCASLLIVCFLLASCGNDVETDTNSETDTSVNTDTSTDTDTDTDTEEEEEPKSFSVTFVFGNGQDDKVVTVDNGKNISPRDMPADPSRDGYEFQGWYDGSTIWLPSAIKEDLTITAKWKASLNSVVFDANGGTGVMSPMLIQTDGSDKLTANTFTFDGFSFLGWSTTPDGEVEYEDKDEYQMGTSKVNTLYAVWGTIAYIIEYDLAGGVQNELNPSSYSVDEVKEFLAPTKAGYDFAGWTINDTIVSTTDGLTGDIALVATWILERHTITYVGIEDAEHSNPTDFDASDEITLTDASKYGYTFVGWYLDSEYVNQVTTIELNTQSDITLYAKFDINRFTITYRLDDGAINSEENLTEYTVETSFTFIDPTFNKPGYEFGGWYIEGTDEYIEYLIPGERTGDLILIGNLNLIEYKVIYANNQGVSVNPTIYTVNDSATTITPPSIGKTGYTFHGWYLEEEYVNKVTQISIDPSDPKDIIVYGKFTLDTYTITYVVGDMENVSNPNPTTYDILTVVEFATAYSGDYATLGWYANAGLTTKIESTAGKTGNLTIYAKWATADNQPTILMPVEKIDTMYADGSGRRDDVIYNLFNGDKSTPGIYSDGDDWFGSVGDKITIEFTEELEVYLVYAYVTGNWTFSSYNFYDADGKAVLTASACGQSNEGQAMDVAEQVTLYESATPIKVKKLVIEITGLKWNDPKTHKVTEVEIFIKNPDYIPE